MTGPILPIGVQDFRTLREDGSRYVDKTSLVLELVRSGRYYFLSRPRRFGKSLLLDTFRRLFQGEEELFRELAIHKHWDWAKTNPVVRLSFGAKYDEAGDLENNIYAQLTRINNKERLDSSYQQLQSNLDRLSHVISHLHEKTGRRAVVLVDEYDKPILDALDNSELAIANRNYLRGFYGVIKDCAEHVEFVFVTGISMFSKVNLFSGLNNLRDVSLSPEFATICGYTDNEIDTVFHLELVGLDRAEIRHWYNGYHWRGKEKVYNPYDVLLLLQNREFNPYWFATGSPEFLFRTLMDQEISPMELEKRLAPQRQISTFDLGKINIDSLLFQTGYLTIIDERRRGNQNYFLLDYPNFEVHQSLNEGLLAKITDGRVNPAEEGEKLIDFLKKNDFNGFGDRLRSFLSGVPYLWHENGNLARYESWYASMLYMCFCAIGADLRLEEVTNRGRADMVILCSDQVFVLEFKITKNQQSADKTMTKAIAQMMDRGYAEKYKILGKPIFLVGLVFGREERNLLDVQAKIFDSPQ